MEYFSEINPPNKHMNKNPAGLFVELGCFFWMQNTIKVKEIEIFSHIHS